VRTSDLAKYFGSESHSSPGGKAQKHACDQWREYFIGRHQVLSALIVRGAALHEVLSPVQEGRGAILFCVR
jgi:hypothetical protein